MSNREMQQVIKALREQGWRVETSGKHPKAFHSSGEGAMVGLSFTPSDKRTLDNVIAKLRRQGFIWPWNAQAKKAYKRRER